MSSTIVTWIRHDPIPTWSRGRATGCSPMRVRRGLSMWGSAFLAGGRHPAPTLQRRSWFLRAGDTVETKRAVHRFSAIRMRSLNDPRQSSLPTALLHLESGANGFRRSGADREDGGPVHRHFPGAGETVAAPRRTRCSADPGFRVR
jgi:hypothetical protein